MDCSIIWMCFEENNRPNGMWQGDEENTIAFICCCAWSTRALASHRERNILSVLYSIISFRCIGQFLSEALSEAPSGQLAQRDGSVPCSLAWYSMQLTHRGVKMQLPWPWPNHWHLKQRRRYGDFGIGVTFLNAAGIFVKQNVIMYVFVVFFHLCWGKYASCVSSIPASSWHLELHGLRDQYGVTFTGTSTNVVFWEGFQLKPAF